MFTVTHCTYNRYEPDESEFYREFPKGRDTYTFYYFLSKVKLVIQKRTHLVSPNTILIMTPQTPYSFYANDNSYISSYFRFHATQADMALFQIPYNTPFTITNPSTLFHSLSQICSRTHFESDKVEQMEIHSYCNILFCDIHKQLIEQSALPTANQHVDTADLTKYQLINQLRTEVFSNLFYNWNVDIMAQKVHMSSKQFRIYYKKFFHCTPKEELIEQRINLAKIHLLTSDFSISDIAFFTGFQSIYYFSNCFSKIEGCSPSQYRQLYATLPNKPNLNSSIKC